MVPRLLLLALLAGGRAHHMALASGPKCPHGLPLMQPLLRWGLHRGLRRQQQRQQNSKTLGYEPSWQNEGLLHLHELWTALYFIDTIWCNASFLVRRPPLSTYVSVHV